MTLQTELVLVADLSKTLGKLVVAAPEEKKGQVELSEVLVQRAEENVWKQVQEINFKDRS